jgi:acyl carrier protein
MSGTKAVIKQVLGTLRPLPGGGAALPDETDLVNGLGLDSIEMLQFLLELEARLALSIDFVRLDYAAFFSVSALAAALDAMPKRSAAAAP